MILILDIAVAAAIIYFLLQFFAKIVAEKVLKKPFPQWGKGALVVISIVLGALCFLANK
jgi:hypothetical protein